jgi:CO dehydrogenase/acetyl-CoA synthase beta subunit
MAKQPAREVLATVPVSYTPGGVKIVLKGAKITAKKLILRVSRGSS